MLRLVIHQITINSNGENMYYLFLYMCAWQAGANVTYVSNNSLVRAARKGLTETVKCLLEAGADPNCPDEVTFSHIFSR
jgi:ankyrin repeat protein